MSVQGKWSAVAMVARWCVLWIVFLGFNFANLTVLSAQETPKPETQAKIREYEASPEKVNEPVDGELPLIKAVKAGDYVLVKWLLENGADVDAKSEEGVRAIEEVKDLRMAELLVGFRADLDAGVGSAVMNHAFAKSAEERKSWKQLVSLYVSHGAEYSVSNAIMMEDQEHIQEALSDLEKDELTGAIKEILVEACRFGKTGITKFLIDTYQVDVNEPIRPGAVPIFYAGVTHLDILQLMIDRGADLSLTFDPDGNGNAKKASKSSDDALGEALEKAFENMADKSMMLNPDYSILHWATWAGPSESVRLLLNAGLDPLISPAGTDGELLLIPIENAAFSGSLEKTEVLLLHPRFQQLSEQLRGLILNRCLAQASQMLTQGTFESIMREFEGETEQLANEFLKMAGVSKPNYLAVVKLLLEHGADVNSITHEMTACQRLAIRLGPEKERVRVNQARREVIQYLIENGSQDHLFAAVALDDESAVVRVLTEKKDRINVVAGKGFTPLHLAARMGNQAIVTKLLDAGAEVNSLCIGSTTLFGNKPRLTPLDEAVEGEHAVLAELLKSRGGKTAKEVRVETED